MTAVGTSVSTPLPRPCTMIDPIASTRIAEIADVGVCRPGPTARRLAAVSAIELPDPGVADDRPRCAARRRLQRPPRGGSTSTNVADRPVPPRFVASAPRAKGLDVLPRHRLSSIPSRAKLALSSTFFIGSVHKEENRNGTENWRHRPGLRSRDDRGPDQLPRLDRRQLGGALLAPQGLHARLHDRARLHGEDQARVRIAQREDHRPLGRPVRPSRGLGEGHRGDPGHGPQLSADRRHRLQGVEALRDAPRRGRGRSRWTAPRPTTRRCATSSSSGPTRR